MNDSTLQQLLLQTEVAPPEMVWEKIAVDLDELEADKPLQQQVLQLEEEAPSFVWEQLQPALDDLSIQQKINSVEEIVPASAWEQIEQQLNIEQNDAYVAATLQSTEVTPPADAWSFIEASLEESGAKVISINRNSTKRFYRMAAAAAVFGILAWGGYRLLNNNSTEQSAPIASVQESATPSVVIPVPAQQDSIEDDVQPDVTPTRVQIKERIKQKLKLNDAVAYIETPDHSLENHVPYQGIHHQKQLVPQETNGFSESQYYMLLNDNGELVRVSKKITDLKCVAVSNSTTATAQELKDCNEQLKRWREKMAMAAAFSASAGDIDLNQLSNSISDQQ
ncbi:hypothetical protein [Lacibacter sp. H407]|uniref:hypothetical protein n=1 Tax=Lacibacter sp. H407 TaxID=3133423 RepID=UPI0030C2F4B3